MRRRKSEHDAARKARRARGQQAHERKVERYRRSVTNEPEPEAEPEPEQDDDADWIPRGGSARAYEWLRGDE